MQAHVGLTQPNNDTKNIDTKFFHNIEGDTPLLANRGLEYHNNLLS